MTVNYRIIPWYKLVNKHSKINNEDLLNQDKNHPIITIYFVNNPIIESRRRLNI